MKPRGAGRTTAKPAKETPFFRPFAKLDKLEPKKSPPAAGAAKVPVPRPAPQPARPASPAASGSADADTFAIYMAGVERLEEKPTRLPVAGEVADAPVRPPRLDDADAPARASMRALVTEGLRFDVADDGRELDGRRLDVDPREVRRLRRGEHAVDGELDLHGLGAADARAALDAFVARRAAQGDRVVLVVHGRGNHSPRGQGVLRGEIAAWLTHGATARHVLAFASTSEGGAVLVLLAR